MHTPSARTQDYDETWSGDFYLGSRTRDSVDRRLDLNHSASVACIRSDTRHRGRVSKSPASVRGVPGSTPEIKISIFHHIHMYMHIHKCAHPAASVSQMCTLMSNIHLYNVYVCTSNSAQNTCSKVHATLTAKKMHIYIYTHKHICIRIHMHTNTHAHQRHCTARQRVTTETHNQCTNMHTHTYTHVYTCIRIHIHIRMHIYTYVHVSTYTYMHIYTHPRTTCTYARTQARLERQRSSDCARSLTWRQEAPPFSLSAAIRRGVTLRGQQPNCPTHKEQRIGAQQPQPTEAHHTITTARLQDCTRSSVLVRNQSIIAPAAGHGDDALK